MEFAGRHSFRFGAELNIPARVEGDSRPGVPSTGTECPEVILLASNFTLMGWTL